MAIGPLPPPPAAVMAPTSALRSATIAAVAGVAADAVIGVTPLSSPAGRTPADAATLSIR